MDPSIEVIPQRPAARCYICHSPKVDKVCHHCGRAICDKDDCKSTRLPLEGIFPNQELKGLELEDGYSNFIPIHCRPCARKLHGRWWGERLWKALFRKSRPALPLAPLIEVTVTETLTDKIILDASGKYTVEKTPSENVQREGKVEIACQFIERDRRRLAHYRRRFWLKAGSDVTFNAGFAVLEGTSKLLPLSQPGITTAGIHLAGAPLVDTLLLRGNVNEIDFFRDENNPNNSWNTTLAYTFTGANPYPLPIPTEQREEKSQKQPEEKPVPLPLQLVPTIDPDDAHRTMALTVQLRHDVEFENAKIDELTISTSEAMGLFLRLKPGAALTPQQESKADKATYTAIWRGLKLETDKAKARLDDFVIVFQERLQPTTQIQGKCEVSFTGTSSGLKDVKVFYPWGKKRDDVKVKRQTKVTVEFVLDFGKLRFQTHQRIRPEPMPKPTELLKCSCTALDQHFATLLMRNLQAVGLPLRISKEDPGRISRRNGPRVNRLMEFEGRYYNNQQAIDFHLFFTGEEHEEHPSESFLQADLYVEGLVTQPAMQDQLQTLQKILREQIEKTCQARKVYGFSLPNKPPSGFPGVQSCR